ncbi:MAG: F0F1 ATP synthase subunit epsilon [Candidatus Korobacteraceae bacterium]
MADTLHLQIVTPDRLLVREDTDQVQIPGKNGELGILPGHAPLITELQIGEISYRTGSTMQHLAVAWGFAEVLPDKVTILADAAERAEDIDVKRAQEAKARAEEALRQNAADLDYDAVLYALRRAEVRLAVAARAGQTAAAH